MTSTDDASRALGIFLSEQWGTEVSVGPLGIASAGARRRNLLFDVERDGETLGLVATVIPNKHMQAMDIGVEADSLRLAEQAGMPVPHVHAVCEDDSVLGGPFFVTERVDGETIPRRVLRMVEAHPDLGPRIGHQCGEALARLHAADPSNARKELLRPGVLSPAEQAIETVRTFLDALLTPSPAFELGLRWLRRHCPDRPERFSVLHGDFRNGNLIIGPDGLRATLDWEVCHIGDPMEDLAWLCMRMWRFRNDDREVGGFADLADLRAGYEAAGGTWQPRSFHWWKLLCTLRWGLGMAGQAAAHLDGTVPSIVMAASGRRVAELEYDTLMLLRSQYEPT